MIIVSHYVVNVCDNVVLMQVNNKINNIGREAVKSLGACLC